MQTGHWLLSAEGHVHSAALFMPNRSSLILQAQPKKGGSSAMVDVIVSRRDLIKYTGLLSLGMAAQGVVKAAAPLAETELNAWVIIDRDGQVTLITHRAEMGQGVYQAIPQILAEELEVDLSHVAVRFAPASPEKYGSQVTGGSTSIRLNYKKLLKVAATARTMLVEAAALRWHVPVAECFAEAGSVYHRPSNRSLSYGDLVGLAAAQPVPTNVVLKARTDYRIVGQSLNRKDIPSKVDGTAIFGIDMRIPGLKYSAVARCPSLRGTVKRVDSSAALKVPGVEAVFPVRMQVFDTFREGVAVVAANTWAAFEGKKALEIEWDNTGFEHVDSDELRSRQLEQVTNDPGLTLHDKGNTDAVFASGTETLSAVYVTPYQAHACMEPLNCIANHKGDTVEIWGPIQAPDLVQGHLAKVYGIPKNKVSVNINFLGGGFGRKASNDYPHEAAEVSRIVGAPVQVVWTREDDLTQGPFRPGVTYHFKGSLTAGKIGAMRVKICGQNIDHWRGGDVDKPNKSATEGFVHEYLENLENLRVSDVPFETPVPVIWWRSVYASTNVFAYESFINELALKSGVDRLAFRERHLGEPRNLALIDRLRTISRWEHKDANTGYGVAITECFGSRIGQVVQVSETDTGGVSIDKVWAVVDCGWYVNPDIIRAQIEGSILMALGAATMHEISFKEGIVEQENYHNYLMPRISEMPPVEVVIMENDADAGGIGEPGLPPFAPALTDAIHDLLGVRIRRLPINLNAVEA